MGTCSPWRKSLHIARLMAVPMLLAAAGDTWAAIVPLPYPGFSSGSPGGPGTGAPSAALAGAPDRDRAADPFEELAAVEEARLAAARGATEEVGPLVGLIELSTILPPGRFDLAIGRLLEGSGDHRLVAAMARYWLARRAEERGDPAAAAKLRAPMGLLSKPWVVGPFGDGRASFDVPFPPESETDLPDTARAYVGKERSVGWRRGEEGLVRGALDFGALLRPDTQAAAYVLAFVRVDRGGPAALRLGSPGPLKVWCNGRLVYAADRARSARFDQDAVGIPLAAGWNRLLIKTVVTEGVWRLFARLTAPDGGPLAFSEDWAPGSPVPTAPAAAASGPGRAPVVPVRAIEPLLRERVRAAATPEAAARAGVDLGRYLWLVDPADRDRKEAAAAFEQSVARRPTIEALLGLASAEREQDDARRALERALAVASLPRDRARVLSSLGDIARDQHRDALAVERWQAALAADPRWWPATLSLAGQEQAAGFPSAALARIDGLPAGIARLPSVARARARLLLALDRRPAAEAVWRDLAAKDHDDADLLHELGTGARLRGDGREVVRLMAEAAALRPDMPSLAIGWARGLEGQGDRAGARRVLEQAAGRLPHEPSLASELGRMLDRGGDGAAALAWLRTALRLRPQDPELRRYTETVSARVSASAATAGHRPAGREDDRGDLARRFALPVADLLAGEPRENKTPDKNDQKARGAADPDPAVVLLDRRAVRVHENGLSEAFSQRVVQVRTEAGARDNQEFYVRYTPGSEEVEVLEARIFRRAPGGGLEVLSAADRDDQDLSEPWYGLYYDYRAEVVRFEGLRPGDVIEVQYVVSDVARENQLSGYFGDLQYIAETVPKRRWDYTLIGPKTRAFHFARPEGAGIAVEESASEEGGEHVVSFRVRDVPRIEVEPAMPGMGEVSPYLHVSTYATWDEVGAWYWRLVEEQLVPDDTVRRAAAAAVKPANGRPLTAFDKVRALHALVVGGTRYVGLEFGIHGFRPYKVSQVLARKFGDCKDKAALLTALLTEVGIDAEMVLVRTKRNGRIAPAPASLAVFDHAIVYLPKMGLYLDGTAEFSGVRELPNQDQGIMVLRVGRHGSKLTETPVLPSGENRARRAWTVQLKTDGDADVEEDLQVSGQAASEWRSHYQTRGERLERYGKVWSGRNPGARLLAVDMTGIDDRNHPVEVRARAAVPRLGEPGPDGSLQLMVGARDADLVRTYARLSERRTDLVLGYPWRHEEKLSYRLPAGYQVLSLPEPRQIVSRFGRFELRLEKGQGKAAGTLSTEALLDVAHDRISAADYPDFRRFLAEVDAAMSERIAVGRAPVAVDRGGAGAAHTPGLAPGTSSAARRGTP